MNQYPTFNGLNVSSKFGICGLPIRLDTYKTCSFGCTYCFANARKIMEFKKDLQIANLAQIERVLDRVKTGNFAEDKFLETLVASGITWHCGGMSDPFQLINEELKITNAAIDICNQYEVAILFSTKSDTVHSADIRPDLHSFQLSVTNTLDRKDLEPNVPSFASRLKFYRSLKDAGFKVGIRIQPFIPNVASLDILEAFHDADHFTLEGLKIVPQNKTQIEYITSTVKIPLSAFVNKGLYTLKDEYRREMYRPFISWLKQHKKSYSVSDNDMRWEGNNDCCCGDRLIHKATGFDTTAILRGATLEENEVYKKCKHCICKDLFTSNRCDFGKTVEEYFQSKTGKRNPASRRFQVSTAEQLELFPLSETVSFMKESTS